MFRALWLLICLVLIAKVVFSDLNRGAEPEPPADPRLAQIIELVEQERADAAYEAIAGLLPEITTAEVKQYLYKLRAKIEVDRRHYHYAAASLTLAQQAGDHSMVTADRIDQLKGWIGKMQQERALDDGYRDARNNGIAGELKGQVTILYLYLNDNRWSKWSGRERQQNRQYLQQVTGWYQRRAQEYGLAKPSFDTRFFFLTAPKGITKEWLRSKRFFSDAQQLIARQLGYGSMKEFVDTKAPSGEVALVFHSNGEARSFALSCRNKQTAPQCHYEYAMLTEKVSPGARHTFIPQVQAHEMLHLFGAADLYRIRNARDYAVTDIMNYYSDTLGHATIDPITAWSIGWAQVPDAPFEIENKEK
ncbi:hypothetical protein FCL40_03620 [Ferrimonas sediminicola]|uniref:Uncharacterized protein n=1 Tax=Ferrimonas sediminicola TaxID=2569538 RepID=A0A4U1BG33_9GAMM|nr:hypothetical protein [Ferrimonas sediminicola]TKB50262.1 hypothetical protein FCL40_03620 [Ferrimonas sediminicola]